MSCNLFTNYHNLFITYRNVFITYRNLSNQLLMLMSGYSIAGQLRNQLQLARQLTTTHNKIREVTTGYDELQKNYDPLISSNILSA